MRFEERCLEVVVEPVYVALVNAHVVELSSDGYQSARSIAAALLADQRVSVHGWLRADGSFSEQWPMVDDEKLMLVVAEYPNGGQ